SYCQSLLRLVPPPVDNWEPRHPSPAIADSEDSDNNLGGYAEVHAAQVGGDPRTFKQAMASPQAQHWEAAAADEILTLIANGTWELVELPPGIKDMELRSVDISAAFTNGDLEEVIYMRQPEGFHEGGPNMSDRSVYIYAKGEVHIIMPVYIDDITLASKNTPLLDQTVVDLSKHFKLRHLGETKFLLGVEIIRDRANRSISLSQRQYIIDMLERYSMADCNPVGTPLPPGTKLSKIMHPQT
ncbi:hypothetical protein EST38_g13777, partial [Candolleomyces aberdarensis]